ncbi:MAG TPA: tetratricopeptide repeat protein [Acidiferrobacteraceae bacterium]|nr:tetratricopeptide repeat protein [Acidiferrobacteraceae bacterium]
MRLRKYKNILAVAAATLLAVGGNAMAQVAVKFQETAAAKAFSAKRYQEALKEFRKLNEQNPNNVLILRYLAITLDRLGHYDEAIVIFKEALAIQPNSPSLLFHSGATYYNARRTDEAVAHFRKVENLAPGSKYSKLARQYLEAIAKQVSQLQRPGTPTPWGLYVQMGYQNDDNVFAVPDGSSFVGSKRGNRYTEYLSVEHRFIRSPEWVGTVEASAYRARYTDDVLDGAGVRQHGVTVALQHSSVVKKKSVISSIKAGYTKVNLESGDPYSQSYALTLGARVGFTQNTSTNFHYSYTQDKFSYIGFDPTISSRDANNHALGVTQVWYFNERKGQVSAGAQYNTSQSDGLNFESDGYALNFGAQFPVIWDLRVNLGASYSTSDYNNFVGPVKRETETTNYSAGLTRWFGRHIMTRLTYNVSDVQSNYASLTYDRRAWGLNISYVY